MTAKTSQRTPSTNMELILMENNLPTATEYEKSVKTSYWLNIMRSYGIKYDLLLLSQ